MSFSVKLVLPSMNGKEIAPGIWLIGEPILRPDLGDNKMACLANVGGTLCVVELKLKQEIVDEQSEVEGA